jgi:hypothetical protein
MIDYAVDQADSNPMQSNLDFEQFWNLQKSSEISVISLEVIPHFLH